MSVVKKKANPERAKLLEQVAREDAWFKNRTGAGWRAARLAWSKEPQHDRVKRL